MLQGLTRIRTSRCPPSVVAREPVPTLLYLLRVRVAISLRPPFEAAWRGYAGGVEAVPEVRPQSWTELLEVLAASDWPQVHGLRTQLVYRGLTHATRTLETSL